MDTNKIIRIESLDIEGVIIHVKETITYNGNEITVDESKTHYPNNDTGREKLEEKVKIEDINIYHAVLLVWLGADEGLMRLQKN